MNGWNRKQYFSCWSRCLGFFVCLCYGRRIHYHPLLEKPGAQNRAACENQGKQHKFIDHWKSVKTLCLKIIIIIIIIMIATTTTTTTITTTIIITGDDTKKAKKLTEIQVLTKDFTSYLIRCKSLTL